MYFTKTLIASLNVVASATVGPLAIELKSSLITSEIIREIDLLGSAAAFNLPPLIFDTCFLTVLISFMLQPEARSKSVSSILSFNVIPSAGYDNKEDPPPLIKNTTRSLLLESDI